MDKRQRDYIRRRLAEHEARNAAAVAAEQRDLTRSRDERLADRERRRVEHEARNAEAIARDRSRGALGDPRPHATLTIGGGRKMQRGPVEDKMQRGPIEDKSAAKPDAAENEDTTVDPDVSVVQSERVDVPWKKKRRRADQSGESG